MQTATSTRLTQRGVALYRAGRDGEAITALRRAVADLAEPAAWQYLAAALWRTERRGEALGVLRDAVLSEPEQAWPWLHLGMALRAEERHVEAALAFAEAVAAAESLGLPTELEQAIAGYESLAADERESAQRLSAALEAHEPDAALATRLSALGVVGLGLLRRAQPAAEAMARLVLSLLGRLSPELARDRLVVWSQDDDPRRRRVAAVLTAELAARVPRSYDDLALALLADDEAQVRAAIGDRLLPRWITDDDELPRLLEHHDPVVRQEAIGFVLAGGELDPLRRAYASAEPKVRREALRGFAMAGDVELVSLVLWDEVGVLRAEAARILAAIGDPSALPLLRERAAAEGDAVVREAMATALAELELAGESEPCAGEA
jgi:tetratricopeptide (TPR) repeat protein